MKLKTNVISPLSRFIDYSSKNGKEIVDFFQDFGTEVDTDDVQKGGFCAMGVALNKKLDTDPTAWKIVDGKLYLNLNKAVQTKWLADVPGHLETANRVWHGIQDVTIAALDAE